jgi:DNA-binding transcriptional ArsR family regulator
MPALDDAVADHGHPVDPDRVRDARARLITDEDAQRLASLLGLLADPIRARIVYALDTVEELCVSDIALVLRASEDATGYGLRILRTAGLVRTRRDGRVVCSRLADDLPEPLRERCLRRLVELSRCEAATEQTD